jgi:hypothetical protein
MVVIHAYITHLQFGNPIPNAVEVHRDFLSAESRVDKAAWLSEWELETLCREIIIHADSTIPSTSSLTQWKVLSKVANELKRFEEFISGKFLSPESIMLELHRIAHRQFPWQMSNPTAANLMRYYLVYQYGALGELVRKVTGLTVGEVFFMGMALLGVFMKRLFLVYPADIQIPRLTLEKVDRFLTHFSLPLKDLKKLLVNEREVNDRFVYSYHSLRAFPLIRMSIQGRDAVVCPLPTLLFWRFTSGVYYEICKESGFANAYGEAFGQYVGSILRKTFVSPSHEVIPEDTYRDGKDLKRTVDWVVSEDEVALFIEAKTKRLVAEAKSEILIPQALSGELNKMAGIILQVYKSITDYLEGLYPSSRYKKGWQVFPLIVTLEDWFLMGPKLIGELDKLVIEGLKQQGLPVNMLSDMPYTLCSVYELEQAAQVMNLSGIQAVIGGKTADLRKREYVLDAYLQAEFKEELSHVKFLFPDEYSKFWDDHGMKPERQA